MSIEMYGWAARPDHVVDAGESLTDLPWESQTEWKAKITGLVLFHRWTGNDKLNDWMARVWLEQVFDLLSIGMSPSDAHELCDYFFGEGIPANSTVTMSKALFDKIETIKGFRFNGVKVELTEGHLETLTDVLTAGDLDDDDRPHRHLKERRHTLEFISRARAHLARGDRVGYVQIWD